MIQEPWVSKYAPKTIDDMVLDVEIKNKIKQWIEDKEFPSFTLTGTPGIGKSTLANIIIKEMGIQEYIVQSCSIDGSIDMVKTRIHDFCQMVSDDYKVVVLDEADCLTNVTSNAGAQMALRNIISDSIMDTRFILTCNYQDKLIDALISRCPVIPIKFSVNDIVKHVMKILKKEAITFDVETIKKFTNQVIKPLYPDIRSIVSHAELMSVRGKLEVQAIKQVNYSEIIKMIHESNDIMIIREYLINNEDMFSGDYILLASELFNYYSNDAQKMMIIAEGIFRMSSVVDKEIQFTAMLLTLKNQ